MADARKRARRDGGAGSSPDTAGLPVEPVAGSPVAEEPEAEMVFPAESEPAAVAAPGTVQLPASGLAEDILRQVEAAGSEPAAGAKIELPASGLAEDILGRPSAASVAAAEPAAAAAPDAPEPQAPVPGAHSLSFFAAPAQEQRAAVEATEHLVTFYLDREEYGVDVRQVQEIRRLTEITSIPRAPEFIRGVINLRGRILPVLDLKRKLGLGEVAESRAARIMVVRVRERLIGLLVDGASQVPKIPVSRIEAPPEEVVERGGDYIRGVAKLDDRLIILVELERLLAHELKAAASQGAAARPVAHDTAS